MGGGTFFSRIGLGGYHSCGIENSGLAYCWGQKIFGQVGDGTTGSIQSIRSLVYMPGGVNAFTTITAGGSHTCALGDNRKAYCWGSNSFGQLGDGTTTEKYTPTQVVMPGGVNAFTTITAGDSHTCALGDNGKAYCWGKNDYGQLGLGTGNTINYSVPTPVYMPSGVTTVTDIEGGTQSTCGMMY